jgi:hypothetical protein
MTRIAGALPAPARTQTERLIVRKYPKLTAVAVGAVLAGLLAAITTASIATAEHAALSLLRPARVWCGGTNRKDRSS